MANNNGHFTKYFVHKCVCVGGGEGRGVRKRATASCGSSVLERQSSIDYLCKSRKMTPKIASVSTFN